MRIDVAATLFVVGAASLVAGTVGVALAANRCSGYGWTFKNSDGSTGYAAICVGDCGSGQGCQIGSYSQNPAWRECKCPDETEPPCCRLFWLPDPNGWSFFAGGNCQVQDPQCPPGASCYLRGAGTYEDKYRAQCD